MCMYVHTRLTNDVTLHCSGSWKAHGYEIHASAFVQVQVCASGSASSGKCANARTGARAGRYTKTDADEGASDFAQVIKDENVLMNVCQNLHADPVVNFQVYIKRKINREHQKMQHCGLYT